MGRLGDHCFYSDSARCRAGGFSQQSAATASASSRCYDAAYRSGLVCDDMWVFQSRYCKELMNAWSRAMPFVVGVVCGCFPVLQQSGCLPTMPLCLVCV